MKTSVSLIAALLAGIFQITSVLAVPNVTVVPLGSTDCTAWPDWLPTPDADTTGGLQLVIDQADDDGVDGLYSNPVNYTWPAGQDTPNGFNFTALTFDLRKSLSFAKEYYRCFDGVLRQGYGLNPPAITVAKDQRNGFLTYSDGGYKVEPYAHYVNGTLQPGIFLGAMNLTTWGFNYVLPETCGQLDYYEARLQGLPLDPNTEPHAANGPQFFGFIQVIEFPG